MVMGAINEKGKGKREKNLSLLISNSVLAIKADVNVLLYRNSFDETIQMIEDLAQLARNDSELRSNIEASFEKIIDFKANFLEL